MFRLRAAFLLSLLAGALTLLPALASGSRLETALTRAAVSSLIFGMTGYAAATLCRLYFRRLLERLDSKGGRVDILAEPNDAGPPGP